MIFALVPVKNLLAGKTRLSQIFSRPQREILSLIMLREILGVLRASEKFHWIGVVTNDARVAETVQDLDGELVWEPVQVDENRSIAYGTEICCSKGAESLLVLPADVPLVTVQDIESILNGSPKSPKITICPSKEGTGTNALYRIPPDVIPPRFGPNSFHRHLSEARKKKIDYEVLRLPRVALDIDTPADLRELMKFKKYSTAFGNPFSH